MIEKFLMNADDKMSYEEGLCSIIVPVHNRQEYVAAALESAWNQTYRPLELIIVDDGSTDSSPQVVSEWISNHQNDPTFQIIFHCQKNQGASAARNHGLMLSKGEFIQCLDDDDIMYPTKLETQIAFLKAHTDVDAVACQLYYGDEKLNIKDKTNFRPPFAGEDMIHFILKQDIIGYAPVYRREILMRIGGWKSGLPCGQDNDLNVRIAFGGGKFAVMDIVLGIVRWHKYNRLAGPVKMSQPPGFIGDRYREILSMAQSEGKDSEELIKLICKRLLEGGSTYYSRFMIAHGFACYSTAYELMGKMNNKYKKNKMNLFGGIVRATIEYGRFQISRVLRKLLTIINEAF